MHVNNMFQAAVPRSRSFGWTCLAAPNHAQVSQAGGGQRLLEQLCKQDQSCPDYLVPRDQSRHGKHHKHQESRDHHHHHSERSVMEDHKYLSVWHSDMTKRCLCCIQTCLKLSVWHTDMSEHVCMEYIHV